MFRFLRLKAHPGEQRLMGSSGQARRPDDMAWTLESLANDNANFLANCHLGPTNRETFIFVIVSVSVISIPPSLPSPTLLNDLVMKHASSLSDKPLDIS